ncbi:MAG: transposase [Nitrososphaerales archaeon]
MPEKKRRRYDPEFRDGAVRVVRETGKTIRQVADDLGVSHQTLANWVMKDKIARGERLDPKNVDPQRVKELERENEELKMERDVLKRSVVLWVREATNR